MMVMGIGALTAERYSNYDAESRSGETADAGPLVVLDGLWFPSSS